MTEKKHITINLENITNIAHTGVRRAVLFMGLGLNAANREDFQDYELRKLPNLPGQTSVPIEFFPPNLPADRVAQFKEEFATWVIGCGVRELLEYYALFLDQIHRHGLFVLQSRGQLGSISPEKEQEQFNRRLGVPDKLDELNKKFSIYPNDAECIKQLYEARNCLTHDLGIITTKRCDANGHFALTWRAIEIFGRGAKSGTERSITEMLGVPTEEDVEILRREVMRERRFSSGAKLKLSQQDLWEICYFFRFHSIPSTVKSFVSFLKREELPCGKSESENTEV